MPQQPNPSEKAAATSTDLKSLFDQPAPRLCLGELLQPRHPLYSRRPPRMRNYKRSHFDQIDRNSGKSNLGRAALRQIGRKSVASRPSGASLSEARKPSFDHSLEVARFRSCSHQPPSTRARDLSGWPSASFQLGLSAAAARSTLVSFRSFPAPALLKSCRALKPADPTTVRAPYPFRHPILLPLPQILPCIPVHKSHMYTTCCSGAASTTPGTLPHLTSSRQEQACGCLLLTAHPPVSCEECHRLLRA